MGKKIKVMALFVGVAGVACLLPSLSFSKATGACVNCHTMHNSQDGAAVDAGGPYGALTNANGCVGCHTGTNGDGKNIPYIMGPLPGAGTETAGGSFYWVTVAGTDSLGAAVDGDTRGHNVVGISAQDGEIGSFTPPGWNAGFIANTQVATAATVTWASQLTCAGVYGCHGKHTDAVLGGLDDFSAITGAHHADDSTIDGSSTAASYRFLYGIIGTEDSDWELTVGSADHNQYFGVDRADDTKPTSGLATQTINYLCAECHGNFHSGAANDTLGSDDASFGAAWLRHPTDYDMNNVITKADYAGYNEGSTAYNPVAPVATESETAGVVDKLVTADITVAGDAIVNCVSCHRVHGSPYKDMLRWDYTECNAANAASNQTDCGCFVCHSTKDDV
ncbi:MAG: cytochrome c3 family protein [Pseudomonadota bacterium]